MYSYFGVSYGAEEFEALSEDTQNKVLTCSALRCYRCVTPIDGYNAYVHANGFTFHIECLVKHMQDNKCKVITYPTYEEDIDDG